MQCKRRKIYYYGVSFSDRMREGGVVVLVVATALLYTTMVAAAAASAKEKSADDEDGYCHNFLLQRSTKNHHVCMYVCMSVHLF